MNHRKRPFRRASTFLAFALVLAGSASAPRRAFGAGLAAGAVRVDITPSYPVRLSGYGGRRQESSGVTQRIYARALAFSTDGAPPAVLLAVESLGVPDRMVTELAARLERKAGVARERLAVTFTHTHSAPMLTDVCPTLFGVDIPPEHQSRIDRYTAELSDLLEKAALDALQARVPAQLEWGMGRAGFAANRRAGGGPVDHDMPVLCFRALDGRSIGVAVGYACHCTTLGGDFNELCGDWAGYASELIEAKAPGTVALTVIGCGADADPSPRTGLDLAKRHGREIALEVDRLLVAGLKPLDGALEARFARAQVPFAPPPDRAEWERRARSQDAVGYHARRQLSRLDRGEALQTHLDYPVQAWAFGNDLAIVFLAGEVVVDFSLRLKRDLDGPRLWVAGYSNDAPCYIPSRRILAEGGYEGGSAMIYYDRPGPLDPSVEEKIVDTAIRLVPRGFRSPDLEAENPASLSPDESLAAIRVPDGLHVELAACEPLVVDPVAIDWGADGALWVCEMHDYPSGLDGNGKPGGRVKRLTDADGDWRYDSATTFLDGLPFPTGLMAWRKGVLVCAAPEILYAEDTDGDGKADVRRVLLSGFDTQNFQARVNSLTWGLDGWVHGACGLFGGSIRSERTGAVLELGGRDFRMDPGTGAIEPVAGTSQQGRVRDDFGNWFGNENWSLLWHFPLPDHYVRRNPHVASPAPRVAVASGEHPNQLYPRSRTLRRFNDPEHANQTTSACGPCIYRDDFLGAEYAGNAFACEPVHNLVTRLLLTRDGETFRGTRAPGEAKSELLASKDSWFRPVQALTGPDGALWIVDMYRFVIEHPRWITPERLAQLDVRAGDDKGRIFRVLPAGKSPKRPRDLTRVPAKDLWREIATQNGTYRDLLHREILERKDRESADAASAAAQAWASDGTNAAGCVQSMAALDQLGMLEEPLLAAALRSKSAEIRAAAIRHCEKRFAGSSRIANIALALPDDPDPRVRYQLALSLGEWNDPRAGDALGKIACTAMDDGWMRAAVLASATPHAARALAHVLRNAPDSPERTELVSGLIATAAASAKPAELIELAGHAAPGSGEAVAPGHIALFAKLFDALGPGDAPEALAGSPDVQRVIDAARTIVSAPDSVEVERSAAVALLLRGSARQADDLSLVESLLSPSTPPPVQQAAVSAVARAARPEAVRVLLASIPGAAPAIRGQIVQAILGREEWALELLEGIERGDLRLSDLDASQRQALAKHRGERVARKFEVVAGSAVASSRADVIAKWSSALALKADEAHGAAVFAKVCASCHAFRGQGKAVGPDFLALQDKSPEFLLRSILDPNAAVEPKYLSYALSTRDGRLRAGIVAGETSNAVTLIDATGAEDRVLRKDIASLQSSGLSLMPEGLEQTLQPQDVADVIAYVRGGPRPLGSSSAEEESGARDAFRRVGASGLGEIVSAFDVFQQPSWLGRVTMHYCRQLDGAGKVTWRTKAAPADLAKGAAASFRLAAAMGFLSQPAGSFTLSVNGRAALDFNVTLDDTAWKSADGSVRMSYTVLQRNSEDSTGVLAIDVDSGLLEPGKPALLEVTGSNAGSQRWFGVLVCPEREVAPSGAKPTLKSLVEDLTPGTPEERRRIPSIWEIAIATARRNDVRELQELFRTSLPAASEPLREWQAVVLGGGIVNGIGLVKEWPRERIAEVLRDDAELAERWKRAVDLSFAMADDAEIPTGTRYDALRIVAMADAGHSIPHLARYLAAGTHGELVLGAVAGLADVQSAEAVKLVLDAISEGRAQASLLGDEGVRKVLAIDPAVPPWRLNTPIASTRKELHREHPRAGAAALVSVWRTGPGLERMEVQALEIRDDVPHEPAVRHSIDNGRTWSGLEPLPATLHVAGGVEVWEGGGAKLFDPGSKLLVDVWLRQIALQGVYHNFTYVRTSPDQGRTWSPPHQLKYEAGDDFAPDSPLKPSFINRNEAYYGSNILRLSNGTLLHVVAHANARGDGQNDSRAWRMGSCIFLGRWEAAANEYRWEAGARTEISPDLSSRGLMEPEAAELRDGRVLVIWRGSNTSSTPGRKWWSVSEDAGKSLGPIEELRYDDGSRFYSPSSYHRMIRHSASGKLYWAGNISEVEPKGNSPRYPLVLAEVDESMPSLRKRTVTVLDDRRPGQSDQIQLSNFSLIEDPETRDLELYLTIYGEHPDNVFSADAYRYRVTLK